MTTCIWCGAETEGKEFCVGPCEVLYKSTLPGNCRAASNDARFGRTTCKNCGRKYVGYRKHIGYCTPACRKAGMTKIVASRRGSRFKLLQRDQFRCNYCGASPISDPTVRLALTHIVPASRGGGSTIGNLVTVCFQCGKEKRANSRLIEKETEILAEIAARSAVYGFDITAKVPATEDSFQSDRESYGLL